MAAASLQRVRVRTRCRRISLCYTVSECARVAVKRQRVATSVESGLANIDVVSQLAAFLEASDLCQVNATCKAFGAKNETAFDGLSMTEEASRRVYEDASDEEKAMLPRFNGESWIELYHHLLMLRARLTFDQLVGSYVEYHGRDKTIVQGNKVNGRMEYSEAICGNHIMRAGKHWATFTSLSFENGHTVGVIRPIPGWEKKGLVSFSPALHSFHDDLVQERTTRWEGGVQYCRLGVRSSVFYWSNWRDEYAENTNWEGYNKYNGYCTTLGMFLDLESGTLSLYQYGRRLGTLKDGLAGEYCWIAGFSEAEQYISIQRGYSVFW